LAPGGAAQGARRLGRLLSVLRRRPAVVRGVRGRGRAGVPAMWRDDASTLSVVQRGVQLGVCRGLRVLRRAAAPKRALRRADQEFLIAENRITVTAWAPLTSRFEAGSVRRWPFRLCLAAAAHEKLRCVRAVGQRNGSSARALTSPNRPSLVAAAVTGVSRTCDCGDPRRALQLFLIAENRITVTAWAPLTSRL
jgi:hypothetical protein